MENILLFDTSHASLNKGDDIIMECVREELSPLIAPNFELDLPTHVSAFHWYQIARGLTRVYIYKNCRLKFVGGTNLLTKNMLTYYPQWNINLFNYHVAKGCILVGVGAGAGEVKSNLYTKLLYRKLLNHEFFHSVRDERSKNFVESLGLKAINTGCVTMWKLTPEFCSKIPTEKAKEVVFTLTASNTVDPKDQQLIDILTSTYEKVHFWVQGVDDYAYLHNFQGIDNIHIVPASKDAYDKLLSSTELDYVGTRLHAGIYAIRHQKRSVIIAIDERAREISKDTQLNCIEKSEIDQLPHLLSASIKTDIHMPLDRINTWKAQFFNND
jgi:polysaccharide pyruvyl transferase WcaK-like protein